ncbi:helix-turn-helix transcriptional regulator [Niallia sp. Sow4_A1]|uniref:helix-turn-helix transcriptional regulator n=1 Tax=Niallia sp. Sow4_A1 TaxID=3438793 RepID=UPI003F99C78B
MFPNVMNKYQYDIVLKSIEYMKNNYSDDTLTLDSIANSVNLSKFHFNRVFKKITGIPPRKYLMSIRLYKSKQLLHESNLRLTDICFDVGYNSLSTFTSKFKSEVGISPSTYKEKTSILDFKELQHKKVNGGEITGRIIAPPNFVGTIFIGLFNEFIPSGEPIACSIQNRDGDFLIDGFPNGEFYLFVAGANKKDGLRFPIDTDNLYRCMHLEKISVKDNSINLTYPLKLREKNIADPPIILSLEHLYKKYEKIFMRAN